MFGVTKNLSVHDILMIRACKRDASFRQFVRLYCIRTCIEPEDVTVKLLARYMIEIVKVICPNAMDAIVEELAPDRPSKWYFVEDPEKYDYWQTVFDWAYQKIMFTQVKDIPNYQIPAKFRNEQKIKAEEEAKKQAELIRLMSPKNNPRLVMRNKREPYLTDIQTIVTRKYNPLFGDDRECECGHSYERHFDSYEDMAAVGCKYCDCYEFKEKIK